MSEVLILSAHPDIETSRTNRAMLRAATNLLGVEIADLYSLYPDGEIDVDRECTRLLDARTIVLQFPLQWYSTPSRLKEWQDTILTHMIYLDYDHQGRHLSGRRFMLAVTAGASEATYAEDGRNRYSIDEILRPLQATAYRCGFTWEQPFVVFETRGAPDDVVRAAASRYAARIAGLLSKLEMAA
ncbi:NAD(P)H-dependent oxidoreductase [Lacibacterium aquatile]|uniref:NAD(P)H-dependent oxidoreductase n=1 Tax=Lacibacterium aquatile TaxID=1168082 RepID=A0ABW5DTZ1_9PROT